MSDRAAAVEVKDDDTPVIIRKAAPPRAFRAPVQTDQDRVSCAVAYDQGNGVPLCAVLVPVALSNGRWRVVVDGHVVENPTENDLEALNPGVYRVNELPHEPLVGIEMRWPSGAVHALLILLHPQVEEVGGQTFTEGHLDLFVRQPLPLDDHGEPQTPPHLITSLRRCLTEVDSSELDRGVIRRRAIDADNFRFALASCQYPAGMIDGGVREQPQVLDLTQAGPAEQSFWRLAERVQNDPSVRLTVLTGDQVYLDATAGLFDPGALLDRFAFAYERMFSNRAMQRTMRTSGADLTPVMDDHEVDDNWEPLPGEDENHPSPEIVEAKTQYAANQRRMWPDGKVVAKRLWDMRSWSGFDFFFADTRTERECRCVGNLDAATIMRTKQAASLLQWIKSRRQDPAPGFVVSPSMLLPRRLSLLKHPAMALHADAWCGYPASLHAVLAWLHDHDAQRVVFLSGDEHVSCVARIVIDRPDAPGRNVVVHSIHSSGLYAPYPFANSIAADFPVQDEFTFAYQDPAGEGPRTYRCRVDTCLQPPRDGFAVLYPQRTGGAWQLDVEFNLQGQAPTHCSLWLP